MTYSECELLNARLKRAAADCLIDAINLESDADALYDRANQLRVQADLLSDAANDVWNYCDNYRSGGDSSWDAPF